MSIDNKITFFVLISALLIKMASAPRNSSSRRRWPQEPYPGGKGMDKLKIITMEEYEILQMQQQRIANLLETEQASDIQFMVGNEATKKELIKAHTFVLGVGSIISPKFQAQFRTNKSTYWPKEKPIEVTDVEPGPFKAMLNYLYLGDLSKITKENVANVLDAAKKYLLTGLVEKCMELAMVEMLNVHNVLDVMDVAKLHGEMELADYCLAFIDENIADFIETDEFLALDQKEIAEIFARDTLDSDELTLFQALDRWALKNCLNRNIEHPTGKEKRDALGPALDTIRFAFIDSMDFVEKIVPTGILHEEMQKILLHNFEQTNAKNHRPLPFSFEERKIPRNNKFDVQHCSPKLKISGNGLVLTNFGRHSELNSARAIFPVPRFDLKKTKNSYVTGYFEVRIVTATGYTIRIGYSNKHFSMEGNSLGNFSNSIGIYARGEMHIEGSHIKFENGKWNFKKGDVIGIGLVHSPANSSIQCFATCNGELLDLFDLAPKFIGMELFPIVNFYRAGDSIKANFGKEKWRFNSFHQLLVNEEDEINDLKNLTI